MLKYVYYCILKNYKGILKKKFVGNTHLFILPRTDTDSVYLALLGERSEVSGTYGCVYITRIPDELLDEIVEGEKEYFEDRFEIVEETLAKVKTIEKGTYLITLKDQSKVFSNKEILLIYQQNESTSKRRIYNLVSKLDLETKELDNLSLDMIATKNLAFIKPVRFEIGRI
jgi:hypothetical protein